MSIARSAPPMPRPSACFPCRPLYPSPSRGRSPSPQIGIDIGGDKIEAFHIVEGNQDPHIVRPKPSLAVRLRSADVYVATGMDLEMWSPALIDMSVNPRILGGQKGYVAASAGLKIIETPTTLSRSEGDVHIYGNPHIHTSPLNG
ncbi:MAG: zinc ABC transporter substrate-binding protein, partial [Acidihalobacter sp.]